MPSLLDRPDLPTMATGAGVETSSPLQRPFDTRHLTAEFRQDQPFLSRVWEAIATTFRDVAGALSDTHTGTWAYTIYGLEQQREVHTRCCSDEPFAR